MIHLGRLLDPLIDVDDPFTTVTAQNSRVQRRELGWVVFLLSLSRDLTPDMQDTPGHTAQLQVHITGSSGNKKLVLSVLITPSPVSQFLSLARPVSGKLCGPEQWTDGPSLRPPQPPADNGPSHPRQYHHTRVPQCIAMVTLM